jgi:hypothetical protein
MDKKLTKEWFIKETSKMLKEQGSDDTNEAIECTCEKCKMVEKCEYAWDLYNTNGEFLADK